jgi:DNA-binding MarR family transcriptional regulator
MLERRELCERTRNPADRRRYSVRVTGEGRTMLRRARGMADKVGEEVFGPLSEDEVRHLVKVMGRVMEPYWAAQAVRPRRRPAPSRES